MANALLTDDVIAKELLLQFKNSMGFTKGANRQYDDKFARSGAKIGSTINIRRPQRFEAKDGKAAVLQDVNNQTIPLTLNQRKHVAFQFDSAELTMDIDNFSEMYLKPASLALANKVDLTGLSLASQVYNSVGIPGTTPSTLKTYLQAGQKLNEAGCPVDDRRSVCINPAAQTEIVDGLKGLFQSSEDIKQQYRRGRMGIAAGFDFNMAQNIHTHTVGPLGGTPLVNGGGQSGSTLVTDGWTAAAASRLKKGDVFTIAGVYAINPLTYQSTGQLKQFVVTSDFSSDAGGAGSVGISPEINANASDPYRNVSALPADNAVITVIGAANTVSPLNLAHHKDSFILGCADLYIPKGVDMAARASDKESGISVRFVRQYDSATDEMISRVDILFGWLLAHPEWACRIHG